MAYKTPGVFVEEIPKLPPSIAEVETAIPAFIGYTAVTNKVGSVITPVRITSMLEYETQFGTAPATDILVTVTDNADGTRTATAALSGTAQVNTLYYHMQMYFANGGGPCYIVSVGQATHNGTISKTDLIDGLNTVANFDEPTLLVFPEAVGISTVANAYEVYKAALAQCELLKDRFTIMDCHAGAASTDVPGDFRSGIGTSSLKYGAAYYPFVKTSLSYVFTETSVTVKINAAAAVALNLVTDNGAYNAAKQAAAGLRITLNPSAAIAGIYAAVDGTRGVWKAPANVSLNYVTGPAKNISDDDQKSLNVDTASGKSINAIRFFTGKGTLVWGARTLAGNDNEWRYVPVRRFFNMVEESTKKATSAFVFEPNDANTWTKVQGMIENYLLTLWRAGALQGAKPEHAFYVAVGLGKTMTAQDILEGRMYIEIGMAAVRPAEFIILRFSHMMAQS